MIVSSQSQNTAESVSPATGTGLPGKLDSFAAIAARRLANRQQLKSPAVLLKPTRSLPLAEGATGKAWVSETKIETQEALEEELERQRKLHAPFLQRLAPAQEHQRPRVELTRWNWRMETAADRGNFGGVLAGQGEWEEVTIPHYGGPVGKAVAYYRLEVEVPAAGEETDWFLCFEAADYLARVYCNDRCLGQHEGFFAPFEFSIGPFLKPGAVNTILVELRNDAICKGTKLADGSIVDGDKLYAATGLGWDDPAVGWHHCPPGMGIFGQVHLEARAASWISHAWVRTLDLDGTVEVFLEISGRDFVNPAMEVRYAIYGENFSATLLEPTVLPLPFPVGQGANLYRFEVHLRGVRIWRPESPWLYHLRVTLGKSGTVVDAYSRIFGVRTFELDTDAEPKGRFLLNGEELRLMGANTMGFEQQNVLRGDFDQLRDDLLLAKVCRMNFLRLTQRPVQDAIYDMCDRLGMMTQSDLPLFAVLRRPQFAEAVRQAGEMERLLCPHACNIVVSYINEPFPADWGNAESRHLIREELERFFTAADQLILSINPDRVIKPVDGDYDPPAPGLPDNHCYTHWYVGHGIDAGALHAGHWLPVKDGWNYGCGEYGAEGLDFADLMRRRYPQEWLPGRNEADWSPMKIVEAQTGSHYCFFFDRPRSLDGWVKESHEHQAFATRWMTDAFRRERRMVSIAIHLFIDAWPAGWMKSIMDCERRAKPAYFTYRDALSPVHVSWRTDRLTYAGGESVKAELWLANDQGRELRGATVRYQVLDEDRVVAEGEQAVPVIRNTDVQGLGLVVFPFPSVKTRTAYSLQACVLDEKGAALHEALLEVEVFPATFQPKQPIQVLSGMNVDGLPDFFLPEQIDLSQVHSRSTVFCQATSGLEEIWPLLVEKVRAGATIILLDPPVGTYPISKTINVRVESCGMGPRNFVSRATGHPLVEGFEAKDFRLWYDAGAGYITPLVHRLLLGPGARPVLASGQMGWGQPFEPADAVREYAIGEGRLLLSTLNLNGRHLNPVAREFLLRLARLTSGSRIKDLSPDEAWKSTVEVGESHYSLPVAS